MTVIPGCTNLKKRCVCLAGDLYYQPPESMFRGLISPAMDIWALGVFAYEIISGGISAVTLKYHLQRVQEGFKAELPPDAPPRLQVGHVAAG